MTGPPAAMLTETAYAKINLALHVRRRRADGYHALETVFAFCSDGDTISATPAASTSLTIDGPFAAALSGGDNLVIRAAAAIGVTARLHLIKKLPVASGLGGGSADAAATLRLLARMASVPLPAADIVARLGADVPACIASTTARGEGVGEILTPAASVTGMPVLLINPRIPLSTAAVFSAWDGVDRGALGDWRAARNDLATPATGLVPEIGGLLEWLGAREGSIAARMSGSGATCFALFASEAACDRAVNEADRDFPGYWVMKSALR